MPARFVVRAQVSDPALAASFDRWYRDEHLPDALAAFGAQRAWRGWSEVEPSVHYAVYEFDDARVARAVPGSEALRALVAEFDRVWGGKVTRSRDLVEVAQTIDA